MQDASFITPRVLTDPRTFESVFYSPSSIAAIFNAATVTREEKKLVHVRGIFRKTGTANYNGHYYDQLKDEVGDHSITLITPAILHNKLDDNKTIECSGFITRKLDKRGCIQILVNLVEVLTERANTFSEEETGKMLLIHQKIETGFKDLDAHLKKKVFNNERIEVKVVIGKSAIIDEDIKAALQSAISLFDIEYHRVSLASPEEVIAKIKELDAGEVDVICVSRGGGEDLGLFDDLNVCACILNCKNIIASAIAHAVNVPLFEKLSDKKFTTPTAFGNYLKETYNHAVEELQSSKAKIVNDLTQQLSANYDKQIENLQEQLRLSGNAHEKAKDDLHKTYVERLNVAEAQLKNFEALASRTSVEKLALHAKETAQLRNQIQGLSNQLSSQDQLVDKANRLAADYRRQMEESKRALSPVALVIALVIGLIAGLLIARG